MESIEFLNFVANAVLIVVLLLFSRQSLKKIRKIIDVLTNGELIDHLPYADQRKTGRRWYDSSPYGDNKNKKGGDSL